MWQTWLPEKWRERGPRVERKKWGPFKLYPGAKYSMEEDPDGNWGDAWYLDGQLIYVQKRFVAIPLDATPDGDLSKFDPSKMVMTAMTYDEMRPGCYDRDARVKDFALNWVDGSLPFPTFPRFCGQTFIRDPRPRSRARVREGLQRLDGRGVVCAVGWRQHPALHHAAVGRRARGRGDPAQRRSRARARSASASCPTASACRRSTAPQWDPVFQVCNDTGVTLCMHIGSSSTDPAVSHTTRTRGGGRHARVQQLDGVACRLVVLGQAHQVPEAEARVLRRPDRLDPVRRSSGPTPCGTSTRRGRSRRQRIPEPPSTYYYGRIFGCFTADHHGLHSLAEVGEDNICFETDYPHTDTTWPNSKEYIEKMLADFDDEVCYKVLRGERDQDVGARPEVTPSEVTRPVMTRVYSGSRPIMARKSSVVFKCGKGSAGTGRPSFSQIGSQPSPGW